MILSSWWWIRKIPSFYLTGRIATLHYAARWAVKLKGIGRPRVEPSFIPDVVDEMLRVPDAASVATTHWLETQLGRKVGASTGTNMWGALQLAARMREAGETGAIVTLLCDSGDRYLDTYYPSGLG